MNKELRERLDRIETILMQLVEALAGDDDEDSESGPFGAERDGSQPL